MNAWESPQIYELQRRQRASEAAIDRAKRALGLTGEVERHEHAWDAAIGPGGWARGDGWELAVELRAGANWDPALQKCVGPVGYRWRLTIGGETSEVWLFRGPTARGVVAG